MEISVKERVRQFCQEKKISVREFEKRCNVSNGYFNNLKNGGIAYNKMLIILAAFPELNGDWLATGEGEMLRSESQVQNISGHHNATTMNGDIRQSGEVAAGNVSALFDSNKELISQHGELIRQHSELIRQQDELISIIRDLTGKLTVN
jgi:transcriptional regulator with XRE-family HTH domain